MCISVCSIQDNILKQIYFNFLCFEADGSNYTISTLWVLFSYFLFHSVFIPSEHLWACIVFFSNESREIVSSLLIFSTVAMLNYSSGILLKSIQDLNFHSLSENMSPYMSLFKYFLSIIGKILFIYLRNK